MLLNLIICISRCIKLFFLFTILLSVSPQGLSFLKSDRDCFVFVSVVLKCGKKPFHFLDGSPKREALTCHESNGIISATPVSARKLLMMLSGLVERH